MFSLIKKDLLLYWRRPQALIILLLMPLVLILILGKALGAINSQDIVPIEMKLAVVQLDNRQADLAKLEKDWSKQQIPQSQQDEMKDSLFQIDPINILLKNVLSEKELSKNLSFDLYLEDEKTKVEKENYSAVLTIPSEYTYNFYRSLLNREETVPEWTLQKNESEALASEAVEGILQAFVEEMNYQLLIADKEDLGSVTDLVQIETINQKQPVSMIAYYAIGMCAMFMFYVASNSASAAYEQDETHIYDRIILSNTPVWTFLSGVFFSTVAASFVQLSILFGTSRWLYGVIWPNKIDFFLFTGLLACMVGGFALLLTALSFRFHTDQVSNIFTIVIMLMAFLGGSFIQVAQFGETFEKISVFSPAGAAISTYLTLLQGYPLIDSVTYVIGIGMLTLILVIMALLIQPKRRDS